MIITHGYNKDHRPDCNQIVFGLNVCADGYVPFSGQLFSGNTSDDATYQMNREGLRKLIGRTHFIYIADSKLSTTKNLVYIAKNGSQFISILPASRKEVQDFYQELGLLDSTMETKLPSHWEESYRVENSRKQGDCIIYRIKQGTKSKEGFDTLWVHSSAKAIQDAKRREKAIPKAEKQLATLAKKMNKYHLKKREAQLFDIEIITNIQVVKKQLGRGRPYAKTK